MKVNEPLNRRLWKGVLGLILLVLVGVLGLIGALALGWNNPRPTRAPDWQNASPLPLETGRNETTVSLLGRSGRDFTLEARATPREGEELNGYGLVYRAQGTAAYYVFAVGSDGYYAVLRVAENEESALIDWQQFPHIRRGRRPNRLRVACAGPSCRFYVNDEYAGRVEDSAFLAGEIGLWVRSFGDGTAVAFEDLHLWMGDRPPGVYPHIQVEPLEVAIFYRGERKARRERQFYGLDTEGR